MNKMAIFFYIDDQKYVAVAQLSGQASFFEVAAGVEKASDHGTTGPRKKFLIPRKYFPRKNKIVIICIKGPDGLMDICIKLRK